MDIILSEIKKAIKAYGKEIITQRRLVYVLSDYGIMKDMPAEKRILLSVIDGGYSEEVLHLSKNSGDASLKICSFISDMHNKYGYQIKKLISVFSWLTEGLGMKTIPYEKILQVKEDETITEIVIEGKHRVVDPYSYTPGYKIPDISLFSDQKDWEVEGCEDIIGHIKKVFMDYAITISDVKAIETSTMFFFYIELSSNIRITKLMYMQDEIANAIAPVGCRLIVPIPGTNKIGVEVSKANPTSVSLYSVYRDYKKEEFSLPCYLGVMPNAQPFVIDLTKVGHLMINGISKTGKSNCLHTILFSLLFSCHPCEVKFALIDLQDMEFPMYEKIASNFLVDIGNGCTIVNSNSAAFLFFQNIDMELQYRKSLLSKCTANNLGDYNKKYMNGDLDPQEGHKFLPYIIIVVDELADVCNGISITDKIDKIVKLGVSVGIHLIVSSRNRIKRTMMSEETKKGIQGRISFRQDNAIDSKQIIDSSEALRLSLIGDFLYIDGSLDYAIRVSNSYVSMEQKEMLMRLLSMQVSLKTPYKVQQSTSLSINVQETGLPEFDKRKLYIIGKLIIENGKCTEAFLQKELSCTFNKAHKILLMLDEIGITTKVGGVRKAVVTSIDELKRILK